MDPRESSPRRAADTGRADDTVAKAASATDDDIIRPSSIVRVTWRLTTQEQASPDAAR